MMEARCSIFTTSAIGDFFRGTLCLCSCFPVNMSTISKMEFFGQVNFLKGALVYADYVTTVSKKYSQEIQTAEYGFGLEGVLRTASRR